MKLELLDTYHIRVRLSASIIVLAPLAITIFLCFQEIATLASSTVLIAVLLAFTNYLPIVQRQIYQKNLPFKNYAAQFLMPDDDTLNPSSKKRYYRTLTEIDQSFSGFQHPDTSESFYQCCESAVRYLREKTRANSLILEEILTTAFTGHSIPIRQLEFYCALCLGVLLPHTHCFALNRFLKYLSAITLPSHQI